MKNVGKFVIWSILCIAVFALTAVTPAFAEGAPSARLEGDAIEPSNETDISNTSINELPRMDFAPAQATDSEEKTPAIEEKAPVTEEKIEKTSSTKNRKLSKKIREYWLKIHSEDDSIPMADKKKQAVAPVVTTQSRVTGTSEKSQKVVVSPAAQEKKPEAPAMTNVESDKPAVDDASLVEKNKVVKAKAGKKEEEFAPAPIVSSPLTSAPIVFQKKSSKLSLFSGPLAKMAQRREYRVAEAKRLNIVLPSQGGSFDKLPQSICKLKTTVEDIITRNGASLALSMIFKGHFSDDSKNLKHSNK